ncbi:MAG: tetratricopeptide repeat protein [Planctomycetia bacterium]
MSTPDLPFSSASPPTSRRSLRSWRFGVVMACVAACGCGGIATNDNAAGVKLYQQGNYLGAVNHFQQALAKQPGNADCFYNLGATYHQQAKLFGRPADLQTAEQYYHLCLTRNPNHDACQRGLAVLLVEENRRDEAMAQLQQWAQRQPGNANPQIEMARLCQEHGDLKEAENHLVDSLAIDPDNPRALVALGQIREAEGQASQALSNYSRALAIDPRQPTVAARAASLSATQAGTSRVASLPPAPAPPSPAVYAAPAMGNAAR